MTNILRFAITGLILFCSLTSTAQKVYISQIFYDSPLEENKQAFPYRAHNNGEFIELYNPSSFSVDISGWGLWGDGRTEEIRFSNGTVVLPRSYLVVAYRYFNGQFRLSELFPDIKNFETTGQIIYQNKIILDNKGETVTLVDKSNTVIDRMSYNGTGRGPLFARNGIGKVNYECIALHRRRVTIDQNGNGTFVAADWEKGPVIPFGKEVLTVVVPEIPGQPEKEDFPDKNYIRTQTMLDKYRRNYLENMQYFDGLGRSVQIVQRDATPQKRDLVIALEYDDLGREWKNYLPVSVKGNNGAFVADISTKVSNAYTNDQKPYSEIIYESSPLSRIEKQYGPGQDWRSSMGDGHPVSTNYLTNNNADDYLKCAYYYISGNNLSKNGNYNPSQLFVTEITDEDGNKSYEFKNKLEQVVLIRSIDKTQSGNNRLHDTYYVYDDFGNLRYMLPPLLSDLLPATGSWNIDNTDTNAQGLRDYAYSYKYDGYRRCVEKKLPGRDPIYMVYDKADQLILTQDGNQRAKSPREWSFYKYDIFGRLIISGVYSDNKTRSELETEFENELIIESKVVGYYGYSWSKMPRATYDKTLLVNYYDDYSHLLSQADAFYDNLDYTERAGYDEYYGLGKGLLVGTRVKMLDGTGEIVTTIYYDDKERIVQKKSTNHLGGLDKEYYAYTFTGQPKEKLTEHYAPGKDIITETYSYFYDHAGRLLQTKYKLNDMPKVLQSELTYNELGQVETKTVGNGVETTSYTYNIRGWMETQTGFNFSQKLYYTSLPKSGGKACYNGNVSAMTWKSAQEVERGYLFSYDGLNRLQAANYGEDQSLASGTGNFDELLDYDKHGNITSLKRYGLKTSSIFSSNSNTYGILDDLSFSYNGNQVITINDAVPNTLLNDVMEFKNNSEPGYSDYAYNPNGYQSHDINKRITGIRYNYLNLPQELQFREGHKTVYSYDAAGVKRKVRHITAISGITMPVVNTGNLDLPGDKIERELTTDYVGNKIYENGELTLILTSEGYVFKGVSETQVKYAYYYNLKDHLGSNRVTVTDNKQIAEVNHYYPFGLTFSDGYRYKYESPEVLFQQNPFKYNDKELDRMHGLDWYDYSARQYNGMNWPGPDLLAEKRPWISPYAYCSNNPINRIDTDGMDDYRYDEKTGEFILMSETDDEFDRVLGYHFDKKTEEWKQNTRWYQTKVRMDNIEKGILSDGKNFMENSYIIPVGGKGQATEKGVEDFVMQLSDMVRKEIGGAYFSKDGAVSTTHMSIGMYKDNTRTETNSSGHTLWNRTYPDSPMRNSLTGFFHTHPSTAEKRHDISGDDYTSKYNALQHNPNLNFFMLTRPMYWGGKYKNPY
ncbi:MAG: DUF6443 domain-containing protein [Dysgonamonadaceae bacterium]|jgi:RHS repeat-associated protein|nr:DUF6443 domain-containing protein [Dysgonamonadaceae bacterium]